MATVTPNAFINSLTGTLGNTIFKRLNGKIIMANRPKPSQKQSEQQRTNRSKFRDASAFAKAAMLDPARKEYYWKKAKKLKLPNAYTAAITDYMRQPQITTNIRQLNKGLVEVSKKDFQIKRVEVIQKDEQGITQTIQVVSKNKYNECIVSYSHDQILQVEDDAGNIWRYNSHYKRVMIPHAE